MQFRRNRAVRRPRASFGYESLEDRCVPATFGVPWNDATHLSMSFVPDGTPIAGHASDLNAALDSQKPTDVWQREILRAFQTWAAVANVNIGLHADSGDVLGVPGPTQHDPRFGDIRVGGQKMASEALSISVPFDAALSGTLTGDVLINTAVAFDGKQADLFGVALHEAGHVLGLPHSDDPKSPMYSHFNSNSQLTSGDIAAIQALYGARQADPGNDSTSGATEIKPPGSFDGQRPLIAFGDVASNRDVDYLTVKVPSGYSGPITFRLQSAGRSLLAPRLTVLDSRGRTLLGQAQMASGTGDTVSVHLNQAVSGGTYMIRVEGATKDASGVGSYGVAVTFDGRNTVTPVALDAVLRGAYDGLESDAIDAIFRNPDAVLFNDDAHTDDDPTASTRLAPTPGFPQESPRYHAVGSLSDASDVDFFRFEAAKPPKGRPNVMTATVRAVEPNAASPRLVLLDRDFNLVPAQVLANADGTYSIQAGGMKEGAHYYLRVEAGASQTVGNYEFDIDFGPAAARLSTFAEHQLDSDFPSADYHLYVARSQLFQFLLAADSTGAPAGSPVDLSIVDASGRIVFSMTGRVGDVVSAPALFLTPGEYRLRVSIPGTSPAPIRFRLLGQSISDPIGPGVEDPTMTPIYTSPDIPPQYAYPGDIISPTPYLFDPMFLV